MIFLDISKAFDSLDHQLLLEKLLKIGLSLSSMKWFQSYLNRKQVVKHNGGISQVCPFTNGIPQGSCLGPTLFIFYINDLSKYLVNANILMFADDCVLYVSGKDWDYVRGCLQTDLNFFFFFSSFLNIYINWGRKYNLLLNAMKSKAMLICSSANRLPIGSPAPFIAGNRQIMFVHSYCYLGYITQGSDSGPFRTGCVNMFFSNDPFRRYSIFQNCTHIEWIPHYLYPC